MALLESRGVDVEVIEYLKKPPDADTLGGLLKKLGVSAADLIRKGEAELKHADVDLATASESTLIGLMVEVPKLIERPIVEVDDSARIGRPPERVLELFE